MASLTNDRFDLLGLAVFALIVEAPRHPYEIARLLRERGKNQPDSPRSLYHAVARLEKRGLITALETTREGRRPERTVYAPTEHGYEELVDWIDDLLGSVHDNRTFFVALSHIAALTPEQLEPDVRSTGFFRNKSKSVVGAAKKVVADFGGQVPMNMEDLLTLPGVARKTANVVLGTWFKKADGLVVDTHVHRISRRLELTRNDDPQKIEQDLMRIIPREKWILFSHQIIWHGRRLCIARKPKCVDCSLENICHAADKTWSTVEMHKNAKA